MSDVVTVLTVNTAVVLAGMLLLWLVSSRIGDVSFIDAAWGAGFVVIAAVTFAVAGGDETRKALVLAVTAVWGLRLAGYLLWRWRHQGPDPRYVAMLRRAGGHPHRFTLIRVFLLQGGFMLVVSLPVQLGQVYDHPTGLTPQAIAGLALAAIGVFFESVGDAQLVRFKADPANAGQVMDRGLWRYTRHPNYFGDCCTWWGLFLMAVTNPVTALAVLGPVTMTLLLLKWSGIGILERRLTRHRPGYQDYVRRTSPFLPRPPRPTARTN